MSAVNVILPAFAAERRVAAPLLLSAGACCRRAVQQSIDISCRPGAQQQTHRCCGRSNFTPLTNTHYYSSFGLHHYSKLRLIFYYSAMTFSSICNDD